MARINTRRGKINNTKPCVYRYIDTEDGIIKYIGIVYKSDLEKRIMDHAYRDEWCIGKNWEIQYFECENRSEVEAFEAHLIALYETWRYYNKVKATWGINKYLPRVEGWWKSANATQFVDYETIEMMIAFRKLLRNKEIDKARAMFEIFEFLN